MLKVCLKDASRMAIVSITDLQSLVPTQYNGTAVNYGQGEGQLRINETVWGFYVGENREYYFVLEEGAIELSIGAEVARAILEQVRAKWGSGISGELRGVWHDDPTMRMT